MQPQFTQRFAALLYGLFCYVAFFGVFLYSVCFIGGFGVPTKLDGELTVPFASAVTVNLLLLIVFALQHSGMARPAFKRWLTRFIPESIERSTYVLLSNAAMILLFCFWQPMGSVIWNVENEIGRGLIYTVFGLGWGLVFYSTCLINHFDLFGLRQVWLYFQDKEYTSHPLKTPSLYRFVRHPLYVGWLAVIWSAPTMTLAHLVFALAVTGYILIAIQMEEGDLVESLPGYAEYRERVPMLIPQFRRRAATAESVVRSGLVRDLGSDVHRLQRKNA